MQQDIVSRTSLKPFDKRYGALREIYLLLKRDKAAVLVLTNRALDALKFDPVFQTK